MKIAYGLNLDSGNWPEFEADTDAVLGDVVLGPQGLIGLLETHLGLGEEEMPQAIRIRRYMGRLIDLNDSSAFYAKSLQADAWATARELLGWRDELIFYGWDPDQSSAPERLRDLAAVERMNDQTLPTGFSDRFRSVLNALGAAPQLPVSAIPVSTINLTEPMHLLPAPWQALFEALGSRGVSVQDAKACYAGASGREAKLEEIVLLSAEHEWPLAQSLSSWLSQEMEESSMVILCQHDSDKLDQALAMQGLPQTGQGEESAQKGVLQLLPLMLENIWQPVRIEQLMELLSAPLSPVPGFAARRLINVLASRPGLESREWDEAIEKIESSKCEYLTKDGIPPEQARTEAHAFADDLDRWLKRDRVDINRDAQADLIVSVIERLIQHLARFQHLMPMASVAMGHCRDLVMVLSDFGQINKPLLDRIVDDIIGPGRSSSSVREAAGWGVIDHAAQLTGDVDTLIWWGFNDQSAPAVNVWSMDERNWLTSVGAKLDAPSQARARERYHWQTSLQRCKRLLLCRTTVQGGSPAIIHPLWSELENDPRMQGKITQLSAMQLLEQAQPALFGRTLSFTGAMPLSFADSTAIKQFEAGVYDKPAKLSPTSLGSLIGCSFKWLLEQLGVAASDLMNFQSGGAMVGTLAHQVLEDVFDQATIPNSKDAAARAVDSFDRRVPEMAAELLLPENRVECADIRDRVIAAASDLASRFKQAGFNKVVCEEWIHTQLDGIKVNGRADVIAYNESDEAHVIDFKYSFGRNYYQGKIEKGRDIQLITYSRMIDNRPKPVAYYMVPLRSMITAFPAFGEETVEMSESLDEGWERLRKTFSNELQLLRQGEALASGLVDEKEREAARSAQGLIHESPPCRFCDFAALCGLNGEHADA